MQTAQPGDHVRVHYVKRFQDGAVISSRDRGPLELTVGVDHPRLPGLGLALVGLAPGATTTVRVAAAAAYGPPDPSRILRLDRTRFPHDLALPLGKWVRIPDRRGRQRLVRIVEVRPKMVVVDTNHRRAGQSVEVEVYLLGIQSHPPVASREL
jgi:FKBP-type peptidyl-prolyl cis-trans isomerase 2